MGKGTILDELGDGRYMVSIEMDEGGREAKKSRLLLDISNLETQYDAAVLRVDEKKIALDQAADDYNAAIVTYNNTPQEEQDLATLEPYIPALQGAEYDYNLAIATASTIAAQRASLIKEVEKIEATPLNPIVEATCIDGELEVTGDVGLIELAQEAMAGVDTTWVKPGFETKAQYDKATDGTLAWRAGQSPEQVYVNAALLPGVQKWKPTYRTGTITSLVGSVCNVLLDSLPLSSALNMSINQTPNLVNVPIKYRDCNGAAFLVGDHVVVHFVGHDWTSPEVIGFVDNPRPCYTPIWLQVATPLDGFNTGFILAGREVSWEVQWDLTRRTGSAFTTGFAGRTSLWSSETISTSLANRRNSVVGPTLPFDYWQGQQGTVCRLPNGRIDNYLETGNNIYLNNIDRMIGVGHDENEVFILWMAGNTNMNFMTVHDYFGTELRRFVVSMGIGMGSMDGSQIYYFWTSTARSWVQMICLGERIYMVGPMVSGGGVTTLKFACIDRLSGGIIWQRTQNVGQLETCSIGVAADYIFSVVTINPIYSGSASYREIKEIYQRSTENGDLIRTWNIEDICPHPNFNTTGVAYNGDYLYVSGWLHGRFIPYQANSPVLLMFEVDKFTGGLVFVKMVDMRSPEVLGPPPPWPNGDDREALRPLAKTFYYGHKLFVDSVALRKRLFGA